MFKTVMLDNYARKKFESINVQQKWLGQCFGTYDITKIEKQIMLEE
jgi:hypothetical protein